MNEGGEKRMEGNRHSREDKVILGVQVALVVLFYLFAVGGFVFVWYAFYRSVTEGDHPTHALILATIVSFAFTILTTVMTMIFSVIIKEGRKKLPENGGSANEIKIT